MIRKKLICFLFEQHYNSKFYILYIERRIIQQLLYNMSYNNLPAFFQTENPIPNQLLDFPTSLPSVVSPANFEPQHERHQNNTSLANRQLDEPYEVSESDKVPIDLIRLLPPEHEGESAIHQLVEQEERDGDWFCNSFYPDRLYNLFPETFRAFLDEFDNIMESSSRLSLRIRYSQPAIDRLLERENVKTRLDDLYNRIKGFYFRTNVFGMRILIKDFLGTIGFFIDKPLEL